MSLADDLQGLKDTNPEANHRSMEELAGKFMAAESPKYEVILRFQSEEAKSEWLGQMTDGAGEADFYLNWDWEHGVKCDAAKVMDAGLTAEWEDDDEVP